MLSYYLVVKNLERKIERGRKVSVWNKGFDIYIRWLRACEKWCESGEWKVMKSWKKLGLLHMEFVFYIIFCGDAVNIAHLFIVISPLGDIFNRPVSIFFVVVLQMKGSQLILICAAAFLRQALCSTAYLWCCPLPASGTHSDLSQPSEGVQNGTGSISVFTSVNLFSMMRPYLIWRVVVTQVSKNKCSNSNSVSTALQQFCQHSQDRIHRSYQCSK